MARKVEDKKDKKGGKDKMGDDSKLFAFLGVLLTVIGFVIAYATKKDDKYVMFYAKQGLVLFLAWVVVWIVSMFLAFIPFLGMMIVWLAELGLVILWVFGMIYSLSGEMKDIPLIGEFARKFNF
jgi:uncharacterized membrane protein